MLEAIPTIDTSIPRERESAQSPSKLAEQAQQDAEARLSDIYKPFIPPDTSNITHASFLVGNPIAHSRSPALHHVIESVVDDSNGGSTIFHEQLLCETDDLNSFIAFLRLHPKAVGSGVTMPFKVAAMQYMDELTSTAKTVGAINTIFFKTPTKSPSSPPLPHGRWLVGTNTDVIGIRDAILQHTTGTSSTQPPGLSILPDQTQPPDKIATPYRHATALIVGGGGTCRAAVYALHTLLGCRTIYITNRDAAEVAAVIAESASRSTGANIQHLRTERDAALLSAHDLPSLIISCVPDHPPQTAAEHQSRAILELLLTRRKDQSCPLLEMCYHPSPDTRVARSAARAGWTVIGGVEAMIGQGIAQNQLWMKREFDGLTREEVARGVRRVIRNT